MQGNIARLYCNLINYVITHRYSFQRWKQIINTMILKEENKTKIHRLRVIHIVEFDLHFILGAKWRATVQKGSKEKTLHCGQYGGCPGRQAQTVTLMEELRRDYSLLTRTPYTNFDSDASAAYNREIVSVSSLASRGYGIHRNVICVRAKTLQEATYKLKTASQTTETSYQHCT